MILHIFNDQKKFSKGYFQLLKNNKFNMNDFQLIHYGKKDAFFEKKIGVKTTFIKNFFTPLGNLKLYAQLKTADKIIVHSLASPFLLLYIALNKNIASKITWVIWGKDLYFYHLLEKSAFYHKMYEYLRKRAIHRIDKVVVILKEEYDLLVSWYDILPECVECNDLYHYALDTGRSDSPKEKNRYTLLVGNSASLTNRHIDIMKKLAACSEQIETIYCPLSYGGNKKYVKQVIATGNKYFGDRFKPLTGFLPKQAYFQIIQNVDIGIFNYLRQEGLGNIWSLIFKQKTVYINTSTTTYAFFKRIGVKVKSIDTIIQGKLSLLDQESAAENDKRLRTVLSEDICVNTWRKIIYE